MPTKEWVNESGQKRYQPMLDNGALLWETPYLTLWTPDRPYGYHLPVRYRSKRNAERRARREQKWRAQNAWKESPDVD